MNNEMGFSGSEWDSVTQVITLLLRLCGTALVQTVAMCKSMSYEVISWVVTSMLAAAALGCLTLALFVLWKILVLLLKICYKTVSFLLSCLLAWHRSSVFEGHVSKTPAAVNLGMLIFRTPDGQIVDSTGQLVDFTSVPSVTTGREMAIPTSNFVVSKHVVTHQKGVIAIRAETGSPIGMASCIQYKGKGVLMTATHVWREVMKAGAGYLEHNGNQHPIDVCWKPVLVSPVDSLDVVLIDVPSSVLNISLKVSQLRCARLKAMNRICTYGYDREGRFVVAQGVAKHTKGVAHRLFHFASTLPGFSGSPLIHENKVIGVHTGADTSGKNRNEGTITFWNEVGLESDVTEEDEFIYQIEPLGGNGVHTTYYADGFEYDFEQVGKAVRRSRLREIDQANFDWFEDTVEEEAMVVRALESIGLTDFPRGSALAPLNKTPKVKKTRKSSPPVSLTSTLESSGSTLSAGIAGSKRQRRRRKASDSLSSVGAVTVVPAIRKSTPSRLPRLSTSDRLLQSGVIPPAEQPEKEPVCISKPQDIVVRCVQMSNKRWKEFNRICQRREYHRAFKAGTTERKIELRDSLITLILSSSSELTQTQVQGFLSAL